MRHPVLIVMFLIGAGCRSATTPTQPTQESERPGPEWFRDVTSELGIEYRLTVGPTGDYFMPQVMGSGCDLDANNDDRPDILVLANAGPQEIRRELASFVSDRYCSSGDSRAFWSRLCDDDRRNPLRLARRLERSVFWRHGRSRDNSESRYRPESRTMNANAPPHTPPARRNWLLIGVACAFLCAAVGGGAWWYFRPRNQEPVVPAVDLWHVEPEVAKAINDALDEVRTKPREAQAWGRLGMYLRARLRERLPDRVQDRGGARPGRFRWPYLEGKTLIFASGEGFERPRKAAELAPATRPEPRWWSRISCSSAAT